MWNVHISPHKVYTYTVYYGSTWLLSAWLISRCDIEHLIIRIMFDIYLFFFFSFKYATFALKYTQKFFIGIYLLKS